MKKIVILIIWFLLQGCTDVAVSGAEAVYNRQSIQKNVNDQYATLQAYQALNKDKKLFKDTNISISTFNNELLLTGEVPSQSLKLKAEQIVKKVTDVDEIHNLLIISNPSSSLTQLSDVWITTKIKTKLLATNDIDATRVKVITENGTVYLMGMLLPSEAQIVMDVANDTDGVTRIVKVFKYLRICKV